MFYCCDPICGDNGALYLPQEVAAGLADRLLPLADMATPNLFELTHLSESDPLQTTEAVIEAARGLDIAHVVVTSAPAPQDRIAALAIGEEIWRCETACAPHAPPGMGDFFAAFIWGFISTAMPGFGDRHRDIGRYGNAQYANRHTAAWADKTGRTRHCR